MISPKQQRVIDILKAHDGIAAEDVARQIQSETKAVGAHLRRLAQMGLVHVSGWRKGKHQGQMKLYSCGAGEPVPMAKTIKSMSQSEARKAFNKRNLYDPAAPIMPNTGWVSTIHSRDYVMQHGDHIKFMERFQPHPDPASAWLFNPPKVELQGARYDLV